MENELSREPATPDEIWAILSALVKEREKDELRRKEERKEYELRKKEEQEKYELRKKEEQEKYELRKKEEQEKYELRQQKVDREMEELRRSIQETDRQITRTDARFDSQWGKLMESLVEGDLVGLLSGCGIAVHSIHPRVYGRRNGTHYEFDIVAGNGDEVVVVEVKTTLKSEQVTEFLEKLQRFTVYEPLYRGKRIYGAVAYLKADSSVTLYAERQGLFVIRATGSSASIVNDEEFVPRVF